MLSALVVVKTKRQYLAVASGGVYVCTALMWLRVVDGVKLTLYDWTGALIALCGMLIIVAGWGRT